MASRRYICHATQENAKKGHGSWQAEPMRCRMAEEMVYAAANVEWQRKNVQARQESRRCPAVVALGVYGHKVVLEAS